MEPLQIAGIAAMLAKNAWTVGEALYIFGHDVSHIDRTVTGLATEVKTLSSACALVEDPQQPSSVAKTLLKPPHEQESKLTSNTSMPGFRETELGSNTSDDKTVELLLVRAEEHEEDKLKAAKSRADWKTNFQITEFRDYTLRHAELKAAKLEAETTAYAALDELQEVAWFAEALNWQSPVQRSSPLPRLVVFGQSAVDKIRGKPPKPIVLEMEISFDDEDIASVGFILFDGLSNNHAKLCRSIAGAARANPGLVGNGFFKSKGGRLRYSGSEDFIITEPPTRLLTRTGVLRGQWTYGFDTARRMFLASFAMQGGRSRPVHVVAQSQSSRPTQAATTLQAAH
ncbi:hypothetical protein BST61_g6266 [Cercospora zeina]